MNFKIKNRFTGKVQFECEIDSSYEDRSYAFKLGVAVKLAIKCEADLSGADLSGADLSGADLSGANLHWTNLSGTDLCEANK